MAIKINSQVYIGNDKWILQLEGLSTDTKPTDSFIADGSQFKESDTDSIFVKDTTWKLGKNGQMKDLPVVTPTDNGKILKVEGGVWSLGEDGGLPVMTGKNGKVLGVTLDAQDHEQAEWVTPSGGGGAEKFVVTLTQDAQTEEWTADKTVAEIVAADAAGKIVEGSIMLSEDTKASLLFTKFANTAVMFAGVGLFEGGVAVEAGGIADGGVDSWFVYTQTIPTSSNEPLIVTMTEDAQNPGTFVGDKTFGEVYTAVSAGKTVYISVTGGYSILNSCSLESGTYTIVGAVEGMTFTGTENDYPTVTGN